MKHQDYEPLAVSIERAAAMAGLGRTTIYAALGNGSLGSLKIGKRRLVPVEGLKAWMNSHVVLVDRKDTA